LGNFVSVFEPIIFASGTAILSWPAQSGKTYRVQFKSELGSETWLDLSGDITATSSIATKADKTAVGVRQRFYRIVQVP
jgi:hypothetical protein